VVFQQDFPFYSISEDFKSELLCKVIGGLGVQDNTVQPLQCIEDTKDHDGSTLLVGKDAKKCLLTCIC